MSRDLPAMLRHQSRTLNNRVSASSSENMVNANGSRGAAVVAASRMMSSSPMGTMRISRTTAKLFPRAARCARRNSCYRGPPRTNEESDVSGVGVVFISEPCESIISVSPAIC